MLAGCGRATVCDGSKETPVINIGISGNSGVRQNMESVNKELEKISVEKIGVKVQLVATGRESGDNAFKNRQLGLDVYGMYYNTFCSILW